LGSIYTSVNTNYLTITDAASTYLTSIEAALIYLTITDSISTYLTITDAASIYLTITDATNTYVDITSDQTITGSETFNTIYLNSYVYDSNNSAGSDSQILMTTTEWGKLG
jgi:uncharacterized protein YxeA